MIGNAYLFHTYFLNLGQRKVQIADGKFSVVAGIGSIQISHDILLENVLHVPSLFYNLLSICKLTTYLNCNAHFSKSTCVF